MDDKSSQNIILGNIVDDCYIVSAYDDIEDEKLETICSNAVKTVHGENLAGVIFNFVNVNIIDSYTVNLFIDTTKIILLLGFRVVWTGLKPGVISSMLDLNISLDDIKVSRDIRQGIQLLNSNPNA